MKENSELITKIDVIDTLNELEITTNFISLANVGLLDDFRGADTIIDIVLEETKSMITKLNEKLKKDVHTNIKNQ